MTDDPSKPHAAVEADDALRERTARMAATGDEIALRLGRSLPLEREPSGLARTLSRSGEAGGGRR